MDVKGFRISGHLTKGGFASMPSRAPKRSASCARSVKLLCKKPGEIVEKKRSIRTLKSVASRYQVSIRSYDEAPNPCDTATAGPGGGLTDPINRVVYIEDMMNFEEVLHEIVHVIVYVPTRDPLRGMSNVGEGDLLLPFEKHLARTVAPRQLVHVVNYQHNTIVWEDGSYLQDFGDYERHPRWLKALDRSYKLGLLDRHNRPTFRLPDWSKLSYSERRKMFW